MAQTKTYTAPSIEEAIALAERDLGGQIEIIDSKQIVESNILGKKTFVKIEVRPASRVSTHVEPIPASKPSNKSFMDVLGETTSLVNDTKDKLRNQTLVAELSLMREELQDLNRRFKRMNPPDFPGLFNDVYDELHKSGLSEEQRVSFVRRAFLKLDDKENLTREMIYESIQKEIDRLFSKFPYEEKTAKPVVIALVGPTGVGKTTTLMKLASHPDYFGNKKVAILSTDSYRAGALAPLMAFSKISGTPVEEVRSKKELIEKREQFSNYDVIFLDTPGRSPHFKNYLNEIREYLDEINPTQTLLVMSATTAIEDLFLAGGLFSIVKPTALVVTKFDETTQPGKALALMEEAKLPMAYFTDGQAVPNDITHANGTFIGENIFPRK